MRGRREGEAAVRKYAVYFVVRHPDGSKSGQTATLKALGAYDAFVRATSLAAALGGAEIVAVWKACAGDFRTKRRYGA